MEKMTKEEFEQQVREEMEKPHLFVMGKAGWENYNRVFILKRNLNKEIRKKMASIRLKRKRREKKRKKGFIWTSEVREYYNYAIATREFSGTFEEYLRKCKKDNPDILVLDNTTR
jgi:hypothetical protein